MWLWIKLEYGQLVEVWVERCRKCGVSVDAPRYDPGDHQLRSRTETKMWYCDKSRHGRFRYLSDHLHRVCWSCGYEWLETCVDVEEESDDEGGKQAS